MNKVLTIEKYRDNTSGEIVQAIAYGGRFSDKGKEPGYSSYYALKQLFQDYITEGARPIFDECWLNVGTQGAINWVCVNVGDRILIHDDGFLEVEQEDFFLSTCERVLPDSQAQNFVHRVRAMQYIEENPASIQAFVGEDRSCDITYKYNPYVYPQLSWTVEVSTSLGRKQVHPGDYVVQSFGFNTCFHVISKKTFEQTYAKVINVEINNG